MKPNVAAMSGIPRRAPKASTVPSLKPGVSVEMSHPRLTNRSIKNPPNEYMTPARSPRSAKIRAWNFA